MSAPIPFSAIEFYRLAQAWNSVPNAPEALSRSVASRAYYAAFLSARAAASLGRSTHQEVIDHYKLRDGAVNRAIGNGLYQLHELRKQADYDMPPFPTPYATRALHVSKNVLKSLQLSP